MVLRKIAVSLQKELSENQVSQRMQLNTESAINKLALENDNRPILVTEVENGEVKSYGNQEYEIFHNLGRVVNSITIGYSDGLAQVYSIENVNPNQLDRTLFVRVRVVPMKINGVTIESDTLTRKLKFLVS